MARAHYSKDKVLNKIVRLLIARGWTVKSNNRHLRIEEPGTKLVLTVPGSPSCPRSALNWISQTRRAGVDLTGCY